MIEGQYCPFQGIEAISMIASQAATMSSFLHYTSYWTSCQEWG